MPHEETWIFSACALEATDFRSFALALVWIRLRQIRPTIHGWSADRKRLRSVGTQVRTSTIRNVFLETTYEECPVEQPLTNAEEIQSVIYRRKP